MSQLNLASLTGDEVYRMLECGDFDHLIHEGLKNRILASRSGREYSRTYGVPGANHITDQLVPRCNS